MPSSVPGWSILIACLCITCALKSAAEEQSHDDRFHREAISFFSKYCEDCHSGGEHAEAGFDITAYDSFESLVQDRDRWRRIRFLVKSGAMPPEDYDLPPTDEERIALLNCLKELFSASCDGSHDPGRVTIRRLSNYEYDNTVRDIISVDFRPSVELGFPSDEVASGFDNQGDALSISPLLLEKYFDSAERITEHVLKKANQSGEKGLLVVRPSDELTPEEAVRETFESFLPRAYRRPIEPIELQQVVDLCTRVLLDGSNFDEAIAAGMQSVLVSPQFLFRLERPSGNESIDENNLGIELIEPYALASRLSYFLWSSMPDESLRESAASGQLLEIENLKEHVIRMLADKKSRSLVKSFMHQWLALDLLRKAEPDQDQFPFWSVHLRDAMIEETERLFARVLRENRPLADLLRSDKFEINPRLAEHYGLKFQDEDPKELYVRGAYNEQDKARRLSHTDRHQMYKHEHQWIFVSAPSHRHGLLTHASILTLTSNATDTSPVKRGKWILEALLGDPPPPAPPTVPSLEETAGSVRDLPLRDQLAAHRSNPSCASCHVKMDALGLAMQNYDPVGRWRDSVEGQVVDASGELEGSTFSGPNELADLLAEREEQIAQNLIRRLLSYALGRGLSGADECTVDKIVKQSAAEDFRLQSLVVGVVLSDPFRMRSINAPDSP